MTKQAKVGASNFQVAPTPRAVVDESYRTQYEQVRNAVNQFNATIELIDRALPSAAPRAVVDLYDRLLDAAYESIREARRVVTGAYVEAMLKTLIVKHRCEITHIYECDTGSELTGSLSVNDVHVALADNRSVIVGVCNRYGAAYIEFWNQTAPVDVIQNYDLWINAKYPQIERFAEALKEAADDADRVHYLPFQLSLRCLTLPEAGKAKIEPSLADFLRDREYVRVASFTEA